MAPFATTRDYGAQATLLRDEVRVKRQGLRAPAFSCSVEQAMYSFVLRADPQQASALGD